MSWFRFLFVFALCLAGMPAFADDNCRTILAELEVIGSRGLMPMVLEPEDLHRALAFLAEQADGAPIPAYDAGIIIPHPSGAGFAAFGQHGQICFRISLPQDAFKAFVRATMGISA